MSTIIEIDEVNKVFATGEHAVKDLSLNIKEGEIIALLGPCLLYTSDAADD